MGRGSPRGKRIIVSLTRREVVHADDVFWPLGDGGDLRDGKRRGVGGDDAGIRDDSLQERHALVNPFSWGSARRPVHACGESVDD